MIKVIKGGITAPIGFKAAGVNSGVKRKKPDLALIVSVVEAKVAAVFTKNKVKAAPVLVASKKVRSGVSKALIINSGNANCCTGKNGLKDAKKMTKLTASKLGVADKDVLVASTGIIGRKLPMKRIERGISKIVPKLSSRGGRVVAKAILTTDTKLKEEAVSFKIGAKLVKIGGMVKGAGMIEPNMATMIGVLTTDVSITVRLLNKALKEACRKSFNSISVDGCMSTNDCVFIFSNGMSGAKTINKKNAAFKKFQEALDYVCLSLAKKIVQDGEGATKFIEVEVKNAKRGADADKVGKAVINSLLFKTAMCGEDDNWGRIMAAVGSSGVKVVPGKISVFLNGSKVVTSGTRVKYDKKTVKGSLKKKDIKVIVDLGSGSKSATVFSCDISKKYVDINAHL